jgi:hypothetical protein
METDQASEEFPRLAIEILDAQRQTKLDVHQFAEDDVPQLIDLIDRKVRDPSHRTCLIKTQRFSGTPTQDYPETPEGHCSRCPEAIVWNLSTTTRFLPYRRRVDDRRWYTVCEACIRRLTERDLEGRERGH